MASTTDFEREILMILTEVDAECQRLELRVQRVENELETARHKRATLQDALDIYREHYKLPVPERPIDHAMREKLGGMTVKEMMVALVQESEQNLFRVVDLNRKLVQSGMFKDEVAAGLSVYSTLGRNRKTFVKVARGQYMLNPTLPDAGPARTRGTIKQPTSGLVEKVAEILEEHPSWERKQTTDELVRQGWDFGGKQPTFAVSAAYMRLAKLEKDRKKVSPN